MTKVQKEKVFERFRLGHKDKDIAKEMGCSVGNIRNIKTRWNERIGKERTKDLECPLNNREKLREFFEYEAQGFNDSQLAQFYRISLKQVCFIKTTWKGLSVSYSRIKVFNK